MEEWMTIGQVAKKLDVNHMWVRRRIWNGEIAATDERLPGSKRPQYRVSAKAVDDYFNRRRISIPEPVAAKT